MSPPMPDREGLLGDYITCGCGKCFRYPKRLRDLDKAFGRVIGGKPGMTCDECSNVIINGSPEELDELIAKWKEQHQ